MDNPTTNGQKLVERNPDGTVKSGILNPNGRPKGAKHFTTLVKEALVKIATTDTGEKIEVQKALGEKVVRMALEGNEQMIKLIWNYLDGMPKASLEIDDQRVDETKKTLRELMDKMNEKQQ